MATTKATNLGHRSDVTLKGTTTTVDSNVVVSDTTTINNAGADVGLKINSESTGHIMQLQDSGTDVMVVEDGGNVGIGVDPARAFQVEGFGHFGTATAGVTIGENSGVASVYGLNAVGDTYKPLEIRTGASGTGFYQDTSGNVGIGTTIPSSSADTNLHVKGTSTASIHIEDDEKRWEHFVNGYYLIREVGSSTNTRFFIEEDTGNIGLNTTSFSSTASGRTILELNGSSTVLFNISIGGTRQGYMYHDTNNMYFYNVQSNALIFGTNNAERGKFTSDGRFVTNNQISAGGGLYISTTSTGADRKLSSASSGSSPITLYWGNQTVTTSSDVRLKENITDTEINGLEKINQLQVKDFTWNDPTDIGINNRNVRGKWTGLIAQEIINVLPFTVNAPRDEETLLPIEDALTDDGEILPWNVEFNYMVPVLVKAIQELSAKVTALENA